MTDTVIFTTANTADALAAGYESADPNGLTVRLEAHPTIRPIVHVAINGAEISLFGAAEVSALERALEVARKLAMREVA